MKNKQQMVDEEKVKKLHEAFQNRAERYFSDEESIILAKSYMRMKLFSDTPTKMEALTKTPGLAEKLSNVSDEFCRILDPEVRDLRKMFLRSMEYFMSGAGYTFRY